MIIKILILLFLIIGADLSRAQSKYSGASYSNLLISKTSGLPEVTKSRVLFFNNSSAKHMFRLHHIKEFSGTIRYQIMMNNSKTITPPKMITANLALRFAMEMSSLGAMGYWGHEQLEGAGKYFLMIGVPVTAALIWGTFTVPNDPSRGQDGYVKVPGAARLLIELAFFGFATWALYDLEQPEMAIGLGSATLIHYTISFERIKWLLKQ